MGLYQKLLLLALSLVAGTSKLLACSSCGSGGADPVILNPNETGKFYLGLAQQSQFQDIDSHGDKQPSFGPKIKQTLDLAYAQRIHPRIFASAVFNFGRNLDDAGTDMQNGDVTLNTRTTLYLQNFAEPWLPQIQLLFSHRLAAGRSVQESQREHYRDVFGAGYDETYLGADLWCGMLPIMFGGSVLYGFPGRQETPSGLLQVGRMQRLIATFGTMPMAEFKVIGGLIHDQRGGSTLDGDDQPNSDKLSHDLFLTAETLLNEASNYRLTLARRAALLKNKNASAATVVTLAWQRAL